MEVIKEKLLKDKPSIIPYESIEETLNQMNYNICKIKMEDGAQGTGFFCKIPFPNKENLMPVLITNNHIISQESLSRENEIISLMVRNEQKVKNLNLNNRINYTNQDYDITIIELKEKDDIQNFLELDDNIIDTILSNEDNDTSNRVYLKETLYILQYPEGKLSVSYGILENISIDKKFNFNHSCSTKAGSSGSPIINLSTRKIIGIHKEGIQGNNYNRATFLNYPIRAFIKEKIKENYKNTIINKSSNIEVIKEINNDVKGKFSILMPLKKSALINYILPMDNLIQKLYNIANSTNLNAKLIYKATRDGDSIKNFSDKCGNIKNTLIIIKTTENLIFGGFTRETWGSQNIDKKDDLAFCFSVKNNKIYDSVKGSYSIFFYPGNIFGFFWFIDIKENCLTNGGSDHTPWSKGYYEGITNSKFELNEGKEDFKISEFECYQIS